MNPLSEFSHYYPSFQEQNSIQQFSNLTENLSNKKESPSFFTKSHTLEIANRVLNIWQKIKELIRLENQTTLPIEASEDVGILIHGCHLGAAEWESIVFGREGLKGRLQVGMDEAIQRKARYIFWGSGASQTEKGIKEAAYTYSLALNEKLFDLAKYFKQDPQDLSLYLQKVSILDIASQNTREEIEKASSFCLSKGIKQLILISSPTHIPRCLQEACVIKAKNPSMKLNFYARASDTCYAQSSPQDVAIIEPPHRLDYPQVNFSKPVKQMIPLMKNQAKAQNFYRDFIQLIGRYQ